MTVVPAAVWEILPAPTNGVSAVSWSPCGCAAEGSRVTLSYVPAWFLLGFVRVASPGISVGDNPWTWFMCRLILLEDWLNSGGFCLATPPEALLEALRGLGLPSALVASLAHLAISLFWWDGRSGGVLLVVALPVGSYWVLQGLGPPGVVASWLARVLASTLEVDRRSRSSF